MNSNDPAPGAVTLPEEESDSRIPCHFIIAHPDKPKFLVIKHSGDHWSPPMLKVPAAGSLMYKPAEINRGMMSKYRLRTSVMRVVMEARNYSVIELELHASSQQKMQAIWMGSEEYARFRNRNSDDIDPFASWLEEKEKGLVPELRAPWQKPGWYKIAETWFSRKLEELGIQATGSVQQFKAGWPVACLLRVATTHGDIHFKASYDKPPGEATLTKSLSNLWPDNIAAPLATDEKRNWMVMRDFKMRRENRPSVEHLTEFARTLGKVQVQAMQHMALWESLNCINMNLDFLTNRDQGANKLYSKVKPLLVAGTNPLSEAQVAAFESTAEEMQVLCEELAAFKIPDSLAHLDYRPDNFFVEDKQIRIIDWADVAIAHPFMALCRTLDFFDYYAKDNVAFEGIDKLTTETKDEMRDAYLACFTDFLSADQLQEAFVCARKIYLLFYFYYVAGQIQLIERDTPLGNLLHHLLCSRAKILINQFEE